MARKCFQDVRFFVWSISILLFVDVIAGVYFRSALTTIERRFELSTTKVALLSSSFQIGNLAVMAFVSYYGSRTHRPRFIALGSTLVAIGYLISCLPQFLGGRYEYVDTITNTSTSSSKLVQICDEATPSIVANETSCEKLEYESDNKLYILIVAGLMLSGIGAAPLQPLGMSYIDDYSHPTKSPVYVGIVMTVALIGPAFGFLLGAALLRIWVDAGWMDTSEVKITPRNSSWVGAWWMGFLLTGVMIAIATIPICFFPKSMKRKENKKECVDEHPFNDGANGEQYEDESGKVPHDGKLGIIHASKRLFTNVTYLVIILMWVSAAYNIVGVITFFPKYLEVQFGISASAANMYYGAIAIPCLALGTMLGSFVMKRLNPDRLGMIRLVLFSRSTSTLLTVSFLFLGCETIDIAGVTKPYSNSTDTKTLSPISTCNSGCDCDDGTFAPICGADGLTYLSPCYAGCKGVYSEIPGITQNFTECTCINPKSNDGNDRANWSRPEPCLSTKCGQLVVIVLAIKALSSLIGGVGATPSYVFLMRSVGKKEKAFAIGVSFMITRLLAWIPGPIIYGKAIDSTCIYWADSPCGGKGYCRVYDTDSYRSTFYSILLTAEFLSCTFTFILYLMTKKSKRSDKEKGSHMGIRGPNNSLRAAARLASESEPLNSADINGNNGRLTMKEAFSSTEMLS